MAYKNFTFTPLRPLTEAFYRGHPLSKKLSDKKEATAFIKDWIKRNDIPITRLARDYRGNYRMFLYRRLESLPGHLVDRTNILQWTPGNEHVDLIDGNIGTDHKIGSLPLNT